MFFIGTFALLMIVLAFSAYNYWKWANEQDSQGQVIPFPRKDSQKNEPENKPENGPKDEAKAREKQA